MYRRVMAGADPAVRPDALARRRIALSLGPPAGALLLANILWWAAARAAHFDYFSPATWTRWDSFLYLRIAAHGYTFFSCARLHIYTPADWCGNAGWFPGYPTLIWVLERLGLSGPVAGVVISSAFGFAMLALLWNGFLVQRRDASSVLALGMAAFFFGQVYQRAVFPISMEIFFLLLALWLAVRQRWLAAGLAGAAAAFTYPTGFLIGAALATWVIFDRSVPTLRHKAAAIALSGGLTAMGVVAVLILQRVDTGVWGAFIKVQRKYHYQGLHTPAAKFLVTVGPLFHHRFGLLQAPRVETLLVAVFCLCLLAGVVVHRRGLEPLDRLVVSATLWFWLFPLTVGGDLKLYRSEALLLPSVLLARRLPVALQVIFLLIMMVLAYAMSLVFLYGKVWH